MARTYAPGFASRCFDMQKYLKKYNINQGLAGPGFSAQQALAAQAIFQNCFAIVYGSAVGPVSPIPFRHQP